jgi:hypothetical protein
MSMATFVLVPAMTGLDLHHLPTGHWPMFSRPAELAALLGQIGPG